MNLAFGWIWILVGFLTGMLMGLRFADEGWLGGYGSHRRRLLRLGHVALIMLGVLNILFALTVGQAALGPGARSAASWLMIAGGVTMPLCCVAMAFCRKLTMLFSVPVICLVAGVGILCWGVLAQ